MPRSSRRPARCSIRSSAGLGSEAVELIVDADDAERAAALAIATSRAGMPLRLSDVAADKNAARLRQLSDEVSRIAATLARLSTGPSSAPTPVEVAARGRIARAFQPTLSAPSSARAGCARVSSRRNCSPTPRGTCCSTCSRRKSRISAYRCRACASPPPFPRRPRCGGSRRWSAQGLFVRRADPHDGRRVFVELAPDASGALRRYFAEVGKVAVI